MVISTVAGIVTHFHRNLLGVEDWRTQSGLHSHYALLVATRRELDPVWVGEGIDLNINSLQHTPKNDPEFYFTPFIYEHCKNLASIWLMIIMFCWRQRQTLGGLTDCWLISWIFEPEIWTDHYATDRQTDTNCDSTQELILSEPKNWNIIELIE